MIDNLGMILLPTPPIAKVPQNLFHNRGNETHKSAYANSLSFGLRFNIFMNFKIVKLIIKVNIKFMLLNALFLEHFRNIQLLCKIPNKNYLSIHCLKNFLAISHAFAIFTEKRKKPQFL